MSGPQVDPVIVAKVIQLLDYGHTQRQIATQCGIARDTVAKISRGEIIVTKPKRPICLPGKLVGRCRTCGCQVNLPCYACQIRAHKKAHKKESA